MKNTISQSINQKELKIILLLAVITFVIWQLPYGRIILYPFTILSTWFHEMGHGLMALILGGNFHKLELFADGSGIAYWSGSVFGGNLGAAMVAAAGPIAPTLAGSILLLASKNPNYTKLFLLLLSLVMFASILIWIRTLLGAGIILLIAGIILFIGLKAGNLFCKYTLQFLAMQAFLSLYLSIDYLFSDGGTIGANTYYSDTYHIQENLFLPYWLWGGFIILSSLIIIFFSIKLVGKNSISPSNL
jgi:hypothetical protein